MYLVVVYILSQRMKHENHDYDNYVQLNTMIFMNLSRTVLVVVVVVFLLQRKFLLVNCINATCCSWIAEHHSLHLTTLVSHVV